MKISYRSKKQQTRIGGWRKKYVVLSIALGGALVASGFVAFKLLVDDGNQPPVQPVVGKQVDANTSNKAHKPGNPLSSKAFYVDGSRTVSKLTAEYRQKGDTGKAELMNRIASQPGTTWLIGPSASDKTAARDMKEVERTSKEATQQGTVPVYMLYALPGRDACAGYSKGGFQSEADYLAWIDKIVKALQTDAVIVVEPDAIAHTVNSTCLQAKQVTDRYNLLNKAVTKLHAAPRVLGVYLDAGHSEWLPDPTVLVEPLRKSGIDKAQGVSVNVSFFAETAAVTKWAQQLASLLGDKGVIIDTSRNGKGVAQATGDARWCNPPGRGLGPKPTTYVPDQYIDAYFWGKNAGESDGTCFGHPPAGTFMPEVALELARNAVK